MDNPNIQRKIALELKPYDLVSFCASDKSFNKNICSDDKFWRLKIEKDFPEIFEYFKKTGLILKNPKSTYIRNFVNLSKLIEKNTIYYRDEKPIFKKIKDENGYIKDKIYKVLYSSYSDLRKYKMTYKTYEENKQKVEKTLEKYITKYNLNEIDKNILLSNLRNVIEYSPLVKYF